MELQKAVGHWTPWPAPNIFDVGCFHLCVHKSVHMVHRDSLFLNFIVFVVSAVFLLQLFLWIIKLCCLDDSTAGDTWRCHNECIMTQTRVCSSLKNVPNFFWAPCSQNTVNLEAQPQYQWFKGIKWRMVFLKSFGYFWGFMLTAKKQM